MHKMVQMAFFTNRAPNIHEIWWEGEDRAALVPVAI